MTTHSAKAFTFSRLEPGIIPWTLLGFILLSACVHALGFYLFQTIYPPVAHLAPPPAQVGLIVPGTPEADAILRWIDSEDPALTAEPIKAPVPGLTSLPYIASYETVHAHPAMAAAPEKPLPYPSGVNGVDLVKIAAAHETPSASPAPQEPTVLSFSGPLENAALSPLPPLDVLRETELGTDLLPATFLLGVSDTGDVRYLFIQESSNDKALDAAAGRLLGQVKFRSSSTPITWGFATFHWGAAVFSQPSMTGSAGSREAAP